MIIVQLCVRVRVWLPETQPWGSGCKQGWAGLHATSDIYPLLHLQLLMPLCDQKDPRLCSYPSAFFSNQRCDVIRDARPSRLRLMSYREFLLSFLTVLWRQGRDDGFVPVWYLSLKLRSLTESDDSVLLIPSGLSSDHFSNEADERLSASTLSASLQELWAFFST